MMRMRMRTMATALWALTALLVAIGCTGQESTTGDVSTDDPGPDDSADLADTVVDSFADAADNDCVAAGGYCTQYPVIPDSCVTCDSTGETHYRPAHNPLGAMGCIVEGVGGIPWCCLPHAPATVTDCDTAGGECYPYADPAPCPPGWEIIRSDCGPDGIVCCAPTSPNCG